MSGSGVRYMELKAQGLCVECGKEPPDSLSARCSGCRIKHNKRASESARRNYHKDLPPQPIICPLCDSIPTKFFWHHWNDDIPDLGMWLCPYCNTIVELDERGLVDKYRQLKITTIQLYGESFLQEVKEDG